VRAAGVSDRQITTLRDALVDSKLAQRILSSLSPDVREPVTDAAREAFTSGVATTIKAAALVALVAAGSVMVLWPRRAGHAIGARSGASSPARRTTTKAPRAAG